MAGLDWLRKQRTSSTQNQTRPAWPGAPHHPCQESANRPTRGCIDVSADPSGRRVIGATEFEVRPEGKQHVVIERQGIHHVLRRQLTRHRELVPARLFIEPPPDVGDGIGPWIMEAVDIAPDQLGVGAVASGFDHHAVFHVQSYRRLYVLFEGAKNAHGLQHQDANNLPVVALREGKSRGKVGPLSGLGREAVLGDDRVPPKLVNDVGAGIRRADTHRLDLCLLAGK